MNQDEINKAEWEKEENWTSGPKLLSVYFSHKDSRIIVPKNIPYTGWTINLAKPGGVALLICCILGIVFYVIFFSIIFIYLSNHLDEIKVFFSPLCSL